MKRRILILYAGGTIGMKPTNQGYVPMEGFDRFLLDQLHIKAGAQLPAFDLEELEQRIDSANLVPSDWSQIGQRLLDRWQKYDGFVVLHGTDTMAYTASALSFMLKGTNKPVVMTGSQIPLVETRTDALDNLVTAMILAANYQISEVCVYFNGRLMRGNRCIKMKSAGFDAFDSPNYPWLGQAGINIDIYQHLLLKGGDEDFFIPKYHSDCIAIMQTYPGMSAHTADVLLNNSDLKGLILQTYGAGNPPDANSALIDVFEKALDRGVIILNITQCIHGAVSQGTYATGETLNRMGVISGKDLTLEAAFSKMHFLFGCDLSNNSLRHDLSRSLCGECSDV